MSETILITGASGLLGRALVAKFSQAGFMVLAQYHSHRSTDSEAVHWLAGDFSDVRGIHIFLRRHRKKLTACHYLINNFGPIVERPTADVTGRDLCADFEMQVAPALEISRYLIAHGRLEAVLNIGFEFSGKNRVYRRILGYAMAKDALLLLTRSLAAAFPSVRFNLFSPPSLEGAAVLPKGAKPVPPPLAAERIFRVLMRRHSGIHYRYAPLRTKLKQRKASHGQRN
jgi:NAD(P)-dependent dehydrogenase (short-subunit alcohol dehydrogenase family)